MKLGEIVNTNNWLSVELTLLKLYPDQQDNIQTYRRVYSLLREMEPEKSEIEIIIDQEINEETQEPVIGDVYGVDNESKNKITKVVALEFTSRKKWLGMSISEHTQKEFAELEIISHCLYEMTYMGYNEEEIQKEFSKIKKMVAEYKKMDPEEKKLNTKSIDEFLRDLETE